MAKLGIWQNTMAAGIGINFQCWLSINLQFVWGMVSNSKVIVVIAVKTTLTSNTSLKGENLKHLAISLTIFTHSLPHTNNGMGPTHSILDHNIYDY